MGKNQVASGQIVGVRGVGLFRPFCQGFPWLNPGGSGDTCSKNSFRTAIPSHVRKGDAKGADSQRWQAHLLETHVRFCLAPNFGGVLALAPAPAVAQKRSPYLVYCLRERGRGEFGGQTYGKGNPEFVFDVFRPSPRS